MDARLFDNTQFMPMDDSVDDKGIRNLTFRPVVSTLSCPQCLEKNELNKKDLAEHSIYDVFDKEPVLVHISRQRYKCKICGATFSAGDDPYPDKCSVSKTFCSYLSQQFIKDSSLTYAATEVKYGISSTTAAKALNDYVEQYGKTMIISLQPCYRIMFAPFKYENAVRCCVCGTDNDERNVILGFLENYTAEAMTEYINKNMVVDGIDAIFCAFVPEVVAGLKVAFPNTELVVAPESIKRHIDSFIADSGDGLFNEKTKCLNALKTVMSTKYYKSTDLLDAVVAWETSLPESLEQGLCQLCSDIGRCIQECHNAAAYDENEFSVSEIMNTISLFRKHKTPYGAMIFRIMFSNPHVYVQTKQTPMGAFLNEYSFKPHIAGMQNFCVEIETLTALKV